MKMRDVGARAAMLLMLPMTMAWSQMAGTLTVQPESRLTVRGKSTMKDFECKAKTFAAAVATKMPDASAAVVQGKAGIESVALTVPAADLDCDNGTMNDHMRKAIKAKDHPMISFRLDSYDLAPQADSTRATLRGTLSLGGVDKPISIETTAKAGAAGALIVSGSYELRMTDWGLKPPSLMMGTMKVKEKVTVSFDIHLKP